MTGMLAGKIVGKRNLQMIELPILEIEKGEILVQLQVGSICGSDLPYFNFDTTHPALAGAAAPFQRKWARHILSAPGRWISMQR